MYQQYSLYLRLERLAVGSKCVLCHGINLQTGRPGNKCNCLPENQTKNVLGLMDAAASLRAGMTIKFRQHWWRQSDVLARVDHYKDAQGMLLKGKASTLLRRNNGDAMLPISRSLRLFRFDLLGIRDLYLDCSKRKEDAHT